MSYFSQSKGERDTKNLPAAASEVKLDLPAAPKKSSPDMVSTLGPGMLITGNVVCNGSMQIFGRVTGDIHVTRLNICEGAHVEGKVVAQEAVIDGTFKGTIHGNSVKLRATAVVDGEIFNQSLTIEQNAQFEGVARRLERAVDAPANIQAAGDTPTLSPTAKVVPLSGTVGQAHS